MRPCSGVPRWASCSRRCSRAASSRWPRGSPPVLPCGPSNVYGGPPPRFRRAAGCPYRAPATSWPRSPRRSTCCWPGATTPSPGWSASPATRHTSSAPRSPPSARRRRWPSRTRTRSSRRRRCGRWPSRRSGSPTCSTPCSRWPGPTRGSGRPREPVDLVAAARAAIDRADGAPADDTDRPVLTLVAPAPVRVAASPAEVALVLDNLHRQRLPARPFGGDDRRPARGEVGAAGGGRRRPRHPRGGQGAGLRPVPPPGARGRWRRGPRPRAGGGSGARSGWFGDGGRGEQGGEQGTSPAAAPTSKCAGPRPPEAAATRHPPDTPGSVPGLRVSGPRVGVSGAASRGFRCASRGFWWASRAARGGMSRSPSVAVLRCTTLVDAPPRTVAGVLRDTAVIAAALSGAGHRLTSRTRLVVHR